MRDDWNDLDRTIDAWLIRNMWWVIIALALVLIFLAMTTRCTNDRQGRVPGWNYANASVPIWDYTNTSVNPLKEIVWNASNPSYENCSYYNGPNYRPEGDNGYNPAPENYAWNPQPECWSCHTNTITAYYNYTAMAHSGGNPMGYGEQ